MAGVYPDGNRFKAWRGHNGKRHFLGRFDTREEDQSAYDNFKPETDMPKESAEIQKVALNLIRTDGGRTILVNEEPCLVPGIDGDCQVYCGSKDTSGYGQIRIKGRLVRLHRHLWELSNGPILPGLVVDHLCRNRACCNIKHLRIVTRKINATHNSIGPTAINASKTHCVSGHPFDAANTISRKDRPGTRECLACSRIAKRKYEKKMRTLKAKEKS